MKLLDITKQIVASSSKVLDKYVPAKYDLTLDYVDIFPKSEDEYKELLNQLKTLGKPVWQGSTGNTYMLEEPIETVKGVLNLLRIRTFDESKLIFRGHPDYTIKETQYEEFKEDLLKQGNVNLIKRTDYEMIEIWDKDFEVAIYFPSIPLTQDINKKNLI